MKDQYIDTTKMFRQKEPKKSWLVLMLEKMFPNYVAYFRDNPHGYWFKRRLFGWGWFPVKWQGWAVIVVAIAIAWLGAYVGEVDDAPGMFLIGFALALGLILLFGYWKGEKPRWQWGCRRSIRSRIEKILNAILIKNFKVCKK